MTRYSRETLRSKIEWEGDDGITWFRPDEVPEELEILWEEALLAKARFEDVMDIIMEELDVE